MINKITLLKFNATKKYKIQRLAMQNAYQNVLMECIPYFHTGGAGHY